MSSFLVVSSLLFLFITLSSSKSDITIGYRVTLAIPIEYIQGFVGKAYLSQTDQMPLNFRTALAVEATEGQYACSLNVFLGTVRVWNSGHRSNFYTTQACVLELTKDGDLLLKGADDTVGWRTGTSGQGVQSLQLLETGNLVLVDPNQRIKWQTFNFPTDVLLWKQGLSVATHLTSFPSKTFFYSLEIHRDKIALYFNSADQKTQNKYSYWEFEPSKGRNITFIELNSRGLELYDDKFHKFGQILSHRVEPVRFLALENKTGNFGMYYYSPYSDNFQASFKAINLTCDLPTICAPYGVCTFSNDCSCIRLENSSSADCEVGFTAEGLCGDDEAEMVEVEGARSVLTSGSTVETNLSKAACANLCLSNCSCVAAVYSWGSSTKECSLYDVVRGVKEVNRESGFSYLVKVPNGGSGTGKKRFGLRKWVLILIVVGDGLVLFLVGGGIGYYLIYKRKKRTQNS